jgi:hypothetical protein
VIWQAICAFVLAVDVIVHIIPHVLPDGAVRGWTRILVAIARAVISPVTPVVFKATPAYATESIDRTGTGGIPGSKTHVSVLVSPSTIRTRCRIAAE